MYYLKQAAFVGGILVWDVVFAVVNIGFFISGGAIISLVAAVILVALGVWEVFELKRVFKRAKRAGLATRAEHKLEQFHERQLHSVWESK